MLDVGFIVVSGILGALLPALLRTFLGQDFLAPDKNKYDDSGLEKSRLLYIRFEQVGALFFFFPPFLYTSPVFIHSPHPFGICVGIIGLSQVGAIGYTLWECGLSSAVSYTEYAASRWKIPVFLYLIITSSLTTIGFFSAISVAVTLSLPHERW
jgi:hypothetical protein